MKKWEEIFTEKVKRKKKVSVAFYTTLAVTHYLSYISCFKIVIPKWPSVGSFLGLGTLSHEGFWLLNISIFFPFNIFKQIWKTNSLCFPGILAQNILSFYEKTLCYYKRSLSWLSNKAAVFFSVTEHEADVTAHLPSLQHWTVKWTAVCVYLSYDIEHPNLHRRSSAFPSPDYFMSYSEQIKLFADERRHLPKTRLSNVTLDHTTAFHLSVFQKYHLPSAHCILVGIASSKQEKSHL